MQAAMKPSSPLNSTGPNHLYGPTAFVLILKGAFGRGLWSNGLVIMVWKSLPVRRKRTTNCLGQVESLRMRLPCWRDATWALLHAAAAPQHRAPGPSPTQWAFGRDFGPDGRLFESEQGLPVLGAGPKRTLLLRPEMEARRAAEDISRRSQASDLASSEYEESETPNLHSG